MDDLDPKGNPARVLSAICEARGEPLDDDVVETLAAYCDEAVPVPDSASGAENQQAADVAFEAVGDAMAIAASAIQRYERLQRHAARRGVPELARKYGALVSLARKIMGVLELADQALDSLASLEAKKRRNGDVSF